MVDETRRFHQLHGCECNGDFSMTTRNLAPKACQRECMEEFGTCEWFRQQEAKIEAEALVFITNLGMMCRTAHKHESAVWKELQNFSRFLKTIHPWHHYPCDNAVGMEIVGDRHRFLPIIGASDVGCVWNEKLSNELDDH